MIRQKTKKRRPTGYWTLQNCRKDAKRFQTRSAWHDESGAAFGKAAKNGWLEICCRHMKKLQNPRGFWTLEQCKRDAKRFRTKSEWERNSGSGYNKARSKGWLDECCKHMERLGNSHLRKLYAFEHPDRTVYVGLTFNYQKRYQQHMRRNRLLRAKHKSIGHVFRTYDKLYPREEAAIREQELINKYRREGWTILNKAKAGGLGGNTIKWTLKACLADAKRFSSKKEWAEKSSGAWDAARKNKWINQCCSHMKVRKLLNGTWTKEACKKDAKNWKTRGEWKARSPVAYGTAWRNSWLDECCKHMKAIRFPKGSRKIEDCIQDARKYKSRSEWQRRSCSFYKVAVRNGWVDECCRHMVATRKPAGYWDDKTECLKEALKYESVADWNRCSRSSYKAAIRNNWINACSRHMKRTSPSAKTK